MKLIESSVKILSKDVKDIDTIVEFVTVKTREKEVNEMYKLIEIAGRTCYKSEDKITDDSAKAFVDRMIALGHWAMLEHGTVYLTALNYEVTAPLMLKYKGNKHSVVHGVYVEDTAKGVFETKMKDLYITTNLRVLVENGWLADLQYITPPTELHEKRTTVKFICDRGVSHKLFVA